MNEVLKEKIASFMFSNSDSTAVRQQKKTGFEFDRPILFVETALVSIASFFVYLILKLSVENYFSAFILIVGIGLQIFSLFQYRKTRNFDYSSGLALCSIVTVVALLHSVSPQGVGFSLIWLPIVIALSILVLGKKKAKYVLYYTFVLCFFAEVNIQYLHYFLRDVSPNELFIQNLIAIGLGAWLGFVVVAIIVDSFDGLVAALKVKSETLREAYETNSTLLSLVVHDIATPLSIVLGYTKESEKSLDLHQSDTTHIHRNASKILKIIDNVRKFQSVDNGKLELPITPTDLKQSLDDCCALVSGMSDRKGIAIEIIFARLAQNDASLPISSYKKAQNLFAVMPEQPNETSGDTEPNLLLVEAEPTALVYNVFQNVLTNAIKFSYENSEIKIFICKFENHVDVIFRDFGIGIPDTLKSNLFDPLQSTTRSGTLNESGTGFGMPICKLFVERFGGSIEINSNDDLNQGPTFSEFKLRLQIAKKLDQEK